jgi:hypothetical protein
MSKLWVNIIGILNIIACVSLVIYYIVWLLASASDAFTWGLPVLVAAITASICGVFTLKRRSWRWAFTGFLAACVVGIYLLILACFLSWTVAQWDNSLQLLRLSLSRL